MDIKYGFSVARGFVLTTASLPFVVSRLLPGWWGTCKRSAGAGGSCTSGLFHRGCLLWSNTDGELALACEPKLSVGGGALN